MVAQFKAAATQQADFASKKTTGQGAIADLASDEEDVRLKNIAVVAEAKIAEMERARIPILEAMAAAMTKAAVGADQIKEAADFTKEIDKLALAAKKADVDFTAFKDQATTAIKGDLTTFLGSTITQAKSVGDAFAHLGQSVVSSIQKIVAQLLIEIATRKILKALGLSSGSGDAGKSADKMVAASAVMTVGGTAVKKGADDLQNAADSLMASASMLLEANEAGGASGGGGGGDDGSGGGGASGIVSGLAGLLMAAEGGLVQGPGTATSDSIPARLSTGEFVLRAAAVQDIGLPALALMNRGLHFGSIRGHSIPSFAEGGLVTHGTRSDGVDVNIGLGLDQGLILQHLSSKAAGKVILRHVGNNPKAVSKAISRGQ
jgi:hypothetical protein